MQSIKDSPAIRSSKTKTDKIFQQILKSPTPDQEWDPEEPLVKLFKGPYSQFARINMGFYRIRKFRSLQLVAESLKPLFKIYHLRYQVQVLEGQRYMCYKTFKNLETKRLIDVVPYHLIWTFDFDDEFEEELKSVYFFRFLLGFKTTRTSLEVIFDGQRYHPISAMETALSRKPARSGPDFKITTELPESDELDSSKVIWISPAVETKKILGKLSINRLHDFIAKVRSTLREINPKYVYLANQIRETLLDLVIFDD